MVCTHIGSAIAQWPARFLVGEVSGANSYFWHGFEKFPSPFRGRGQPASWSISLGEPELNDTFHPVTKSPNNIVVIGAGINGLVAANYLMCVSELLRRK